MTTTLAYSPWGGQPLADNDNARPIMIGLTGKRNVGKSTVARLLVHEFGFYSVHAFEAGKEAAVTYFAEITGDFLTAHEMVYGALKDEPSPHLPDNVAPRYFLERFGHFMGHTLGVEWTLAQEIKRARRNAPRQPIVVESVVYEAPWFKRAGGVVWRLERPGHDGPAGVESDSVQALIEADATIAATSLDELEDKARELVRGMV